jgi:hypothetical protein
MNNSNSNIVEVLMKCFIIDRKSGKSFEPYTNGKNYITAYSNVATDKNLFVINVPRLLAGLKEKRYRLILKTIL